MAQAAARGRTESRAVARAVQNTTHNSSQLTRVSRSLSGTAATPLTGHTHHADAHATVSISSSGRGTWVTTHTALPRGWPGAAPRRC